MWLNWQIASGVFSFIGCVNMPKNMKNKISEFYILKKETPYLGVCNKQNVLNFFYKTFFFMNKHHILFYLA